MALPSLIQRIIKQEAARFSAQLIARACADLSQSYRATTPSSALPAASPAHRIAYLVARMPAIYEANLSVIEQMKRLCPTLDINSVLDLGSGPATATLAIAQNFTRLERATLVDRDPQWLETGRRYLHAVDEGLAARSRYIAADLRDAAALREHDLVILSYVVGELGAPAARALIEQVWPLARLAIVIIEAGTPRGFAGVLAVRDCLNAANARIVAPCPHAGRCPLAADDWCHFSARVERTPLHRRAKSATLSYEAEKFSYLVAAKPALPGQNPAARIIRKPLKRDGHVILDLCTSDTTARRLVVSRRNHEQYRRARAAKWGDRWDLAAASDKSEGAEPGNS